MTAGRRPTILSRSPGRFRPCRRHCRPMLRKYRKLPQRRRRSRIGTFSVDACIAAIRAGDHWHDTMLRLVGHWIARGWCDAEILAAAEAMTLPGYTVDTTRRDVARMIAGGRTKWEVPNPEPAIGPSAEDQTLEPGFLYNLNLALLPRRRWILGRSLLRGHVSLLVAPAGVGKSTHGIARAVAVATGRDLTGEPVHEQVKVWIYNIEDDLDELKRRLGAVLQHWSVPFSEIPRAGRAERRRRSAAAVRKGGSPRSGDPPARRRCLHREDPRT